MEKIHVSETEGAQGFSLYEIVKKLNEVIDVINSQSDEKKEEVL